MCCGEAWVLSLWSYSAVLCLHAPLLVIASSRLSACVLSTPNMRLTASCHLPRTRVFCSTLLVILHTPLQCTLPSTHPHNNNQGDAASSNRLLKKHTQSYLSDLSATEEGLHARAAAVLEALGGLLDAIEVI